jgi:uncharacterized protein (TIGR03435 family)
MMRVVAAVSALVSASVLAQTVGTLPTFEVVSVKPSPPDGRFGMKPLPGGKFVATSLSLRTLIRLAFTGSDDQFEGVPRWADEAKYDITAQAGHEASVAELQLMLQSLLLDRFKLVIDRESREMKTYDLVVAKGGMRLRLTDPSARTASATSRGKITATGCSLPWFVVALTPIVRRHVIDKTGLDGRYDFTLEYDPLSDAQALDGATVPQPMAPSIFTALQEQLGLKLEPAKDMIDVYVMRHIERPEEN